MGNIGNLIVNREHAKGPRCHVNQMLFKHDVLDHTKDQIRLIKVRKQLRDATPRCELAIFDFGDAPPYIALSYMWGDPSQTHYIFINEQLFEIRQNLFDFLQVFQEDDANECYLWIDAISIDQMDNAERNHQVSMMSRIYENSSQVVSWLSHKARGPGATERFSQEYIEETLWPLFKNAYFGRLWVVQEILLAPKLLFLYGSLWVPECRLRQAIAGRQLGKYVYLFIERHQRALQQARGLPYNGKCGLRYCMRYFSGGSCENPRDQVYGLLGLVEGANLVVDYSKTIHEVFLDAVLAMYHAQDETEDLQEACMALGRSMGFGYDLLDPLWRMIRSLQLKNIQPDRPIRVGFQREANATNEYWWYEYGDSSRGTKRHQFAVAELSRQETEDLKQKVYGHLFATSKS